MRILIVEDDPKVAALLRDALEKKAHRIFLATTGREGLEIGRSHEFEAIVLDVMLPEIDGFVVARSLREVGVASPILMLTARDATTDIVRGLDSGVELFARLRALARRRTRFHSRRSSS